MAVRVMPSVKVSAEDGMVKVHAITDWEGKAISHDITVWLDDGELHYSHLKREAKSGWTKVPTEAEKE